LPAATGGGGCGAFAQSGLQFDVRRSGQFAAGFINQTLWESNSRVSGSTTVTVPPFIPFERTSGRPFYKQIYDGYRAAILSGRLQPGQRLPSTRALAVELKISRLPVISAYEQLLHEGYIEGKIGAGTYVKDSIPDELAVPAPVRDSAGRQGGPARSLRMAGADSPGTNTSGEKELLGPFRVSLPALDHFPHQVWSRLVSRHAKNLSVNLMAYGDPAGHLPLREAIAQYLRTARAVNCETSQILIVSGSQMALQICAMALLTPRDAACIEEPGYPGARDALRGTGATLIPIALDGEGIGVEEIASRGEKARVVYVTPSSFAIRDSGLRTSPHLPIAEPQLLPAQIRLST